MALLSFKEACAQIGETAQEQPTKPALKLIKFQRPEQVAEGGSTTRDLPGNGKMVAHIIGGDAADNPPTTATETDLASYITPEKAEFGRNLIQFLKDFAYEIWSQHRDVDDVLYDRAKAQEREHEKLSAAAGRAATWFIPCVKMAVDGAVAGYRKAQKKIRQTKAQARRAALAGLPTSFRVDAKTLLRAVVMASLAVDKKAHIPVMLNLLMEVRDNLLWVTGYDFRKGVRTAIQVATIQEGTFGAGMPFTVNAALLEATLKKKKGDINVDFDPATNKLMVDTATLNTITADDYPPSDEIFNQIEKLAYGDSSFGLAVEDVYMALARPVCATQPDDPRPFMGGVYLSGKHFVATDGHRMIRIRGDRALVPDTAKAIIPTATIALAIRTLNECKKAKSINDSSEVRVVVVPDGKAMGFIVDSHTTIISRTVEAEYPNYDKAIPTDKEMCKAEFTAGEMRTAVTEAETMARSKENQNIVEFKFSADDQNVRLFASTQDVGECERFVPATIKGQGLTVCFNSRYVLDVLAPMDDSEVATLYLYDELKATMFTREFGQWDETHVLMPIKI